MLIVKQFDCAETWYNAHFITEKAFRRPKWQTIPYIFYHLPKFITILKCRERKEIWILCNYWFCFGLFNKENVIVSLLAPLSQERTLKETPKDKLTVFLFKIFNNQIQVSKVIKYSVYRYTQMSSVHFNCYLVMFLQKYWILLNLHTYNSRNLIKHP